VNQPSCAVCGGPLRPPLDEHHYEVKGWAKPGRGQHGKSGSSLVLREATGSLAHATCIVSLQHGVTPEQMTIEEVL